MKTINILGRQMPILAILVGLLVIGTASAAVAYFAFSGTIEVTSPFGANQYDAFNIQLKAGDSERYPDLYIQNSANTSILVELNTIVTDSSDQVVSGISILYCDMDGILLSDVDNDGDQELVIPSGGTYIDALVEADEYLETDTYTVNASANPPVDVDFVELTYKDDTTDGGEWNPTDEMDAYVIYAEESSTFDYCVKAIGLDDDTSYSLIYYVDQTDRFNNYLGVFPSKTIATIVTGEYTSEYDEDDMLFETDSFDIGHSLPVSTDANADPVNHDYRGAPDFYENSAGAKLWLVPTSDITSDPDDDQTSKLMTEWNPADYLFECELVHYVYST